jgi:hypothetical protein
MAQTCRSLHIKIKEYRSLLQLKVLKTISFESFCRHSTGCLEFLEIEKRMTKQKTKNRKYVTRCKDYQLAKQITSDLIARIAKIAKIAQKIHKKK